MSETRFDKIRVTVLVVINAIAALTVTALQAVTLKIGGGTTLTKVLTGTANVDPASVAATSFVTATFALSGAKVGDQVTVSPPAALEAGLLVSTSFVSAANTVSIVLFNPTGAAIDGIQRAWSYTLTSAQ